jgi:hypothetical protein
MKDYCMEKYVNNDTVSLRGVDKVNNSVATLIYSGTAFVWLRQTNMPRCARRYAARMRATPLTNQCRYGIYNSAAARRNEPQHISGAAGTR